MDFKKSIGLTPGRAIEIVGQFFPKVWKNLSEDKVAITRSQTGVNNEVYFVTNLCKREELKRAAEPEKVVVRVYSSVMGGKEAAASNREMQDETKMTASEVEEILIMERLANRGLGPRILGVFAGGRVEEMIACRGVTFDDAYDAELEADIAVNLALIHGTSVPLRKPSTEFMTALRKGYGMMMRETSDLQFYKDLGNEELLAAVSHDFQEDFRFMDSLLHLKHHRLVLMNWDPHLENIAVRTTPVLTNTAVQHTLRTVIFDFEVAGYNIRGKDLGLFILSRSGFFPNVRSDRRLESAEETIRFLKSYQSAIADEFEDVDVKGIDSLQHLMAESLIGAWTSAVYFLLYLAARCAKPEAAADAGDEDVAGHSMRPLLSSLAEGMRQCRQALDNRFPDLLSTVFASH